jgi:hypothetical protein
VLRHQWRQNWCCHSSPVARGFVGGGVSIKPHDSEKYKCKMGQKSMSATDSAVCMNGKFIFETLLLFLINGIHSHPFSIMYPIWQQCNNSIIYHRYKGRQVFLGRGGYKHSIVMNASSSRRIREVC